jgi:hypothetical protein
MVDGWGGLWRLGNAPYLPLSGPWMTSHGAAVGPSGPAVFVDNSGTARIAYHAWTGGVGYASGGVRSLWIDTVSFDGGRPHLTSASTAPVYPGDFPDPFILPVADGYWAYSTASGYLRLQAIHSTDLHNWSAPINPLPGLPSWASDGGTWAPGVLVRGSTYIMYYTVRQTSSGRECISAATSSSPGGPFVDRSSGPLVCQLPQGGSIDPDPYVESNGTAYLVWKSEENALGAPTHLWSQQLSADGLSLVGPRVPLFDQTQPWQGPAVEGPDLNHFNPAYYLFYGAGAWDTANASIGYTTCRGPLGPCSQSATYNAGVDYVRSMALAPDNAGGKILTGTGALYNFGGETYAWSCTTWTSDIARGLAFDPASPGFAPRGVILDGYGGIHPLCDSPTINLAGAPYWPDWDIARGIALLPGMTGGYVLDGYGGIHPFGDAKPVTSGPYWTGWDIARGIALDPDGTGGYVLDGYGGIQRFTIATTTTDAAPSVSITAPGGGASVSGSVGITAGATDDKGVTQVQFFVDGNSIGVDRDGSNGWALTWTTTAVANGTHALTATATDTIGQSTTSSPVSVTVNNPVPSIQLSVRAYKVKGYKRADLSWTGATAVVINRNGSQVATDDASPYTDGRDNSLGRGSGSATYEVCSATSPTTCSNQVTVGW